MRRRSHVFDYLRAMAVLDGAAIGYKDQSLLAAYAAEDAKLMAMFLKNSGVLE